MKKSISLKIGAMLLIEVVYLLSHSTLYRLLGTIAWVKTLGSYSEPVSILLGEIPIILILLLVNHFFFKQKILFEKYPFFKGLLVSSYTLIAFLVALIFTLINHKNFGSFLLLIVGALAIGVAEEFLFRGLILGTLISKGKSLLFSVIVSSFLFGLLHAINIFHQPLLNTIIQVGYAMPMGALLAVVYIKTNNLIYPILMHAMQDLMAISVSGTSSSSETSLLAVVQTYIIYLGLAFIILYADTQQMKNFTTRLRGQALEKVAVQLPKLAHNKAFRKGLTIATLSYGLVANIVYVSLTIMLNRANALENTLLALNILLYSSIALYIFLIIFFNYRRRHLCWLLLPVIGGPIFVILALTGAAKERDMVRVSD
ncbi:MAG: CPBP family intramembrane metalloprotease [Streptococcaceae bacterium]|jgi:membrane protease YdiL (CAAX protease family)|nr:CPBP family intramembrane metalloprotease [Streptococcaceae bacterium]